MLKNVLLENHFQDFNDVLGIVSKNIPQETRARRLPYALFYDFILSFFILSIYYTVYDCIT